MKAIVEESTVDDLVFARTRGVVWRSTNETVVLHRVGAEPELAAFEVAGTAALLWVALDEPATLTGLAARLEDAGVAVPDALVLARDMSLLVEAGVAEIVGRTDA